jgi:hypothetical protein
MARGRNSIVDSEDWLGGGGKVLDMMSANTAHLIGSIEPIDEREFNISDPEGRAAYEMFMSEGVVVSVHQTTDENAPPVVGVGCNGDVRWLPREIPVRIPRRFVEILAKSQERKITTKSNPDPSADEGMKTTTRQAQSYPFSVLHDPHPKGRAWLERITRAGC